ncbi:hypothetical protein [Listeria booriae]|nr:hypothetical protein [Listeria booriae]
MNDECALKNELLQLRNGSEWDMETLSESDKKLLAEAYNEIENNNTLKEELELFGIPKDKVSNVSFWISGIVIGNIKI